MKKDVLNEKQLKEILGRAQYWNEVIKREGPVLPILQSELREVIDSLGIKVLWVLEEYANECKRYDF